VTTAAYTMKACGSRNVWLAVWDGRERMLASWEGRVK
jgi:hypothetical protein